MTGVFSADPRIVPDARKLSVVSYEEMLEMSASGAKVLQLRSVEYARNHGVPIHCRSSFEDLPGTLVLPESETMERPIITAVTHSTDEARVTVIGVRDEPGIAGRIFNALAEANVNVDVIIQNEPVGDDALADLSFTVDREDLTTATEALENLGSISHAVRTDERIGKVSIVGAGMRSNPGVAAKVFQVLGEKRINIEMISTSPIRISCVIPADHVPDAVRALHEAFDLGDNAILTRSPDRRASHDPVLMSEGSYRVGVLGATGAVGSTMLGILAERDFPGFGDRAFRLRAFGRQGRSRSVTELECVMPSDDERSRASTS